MSRALLGLLATPVSVVDTEGIRTIDGTGTIIHNPVWIEGDLVGSLSGAFFLGASRRNSDPTRPYHWYWSLSVSGGTATFMLYSRPSKTPADLVASAAGRAGVDGSLTLEPQNESGLYGLVYITASAVSDDDDGNVMRMPAAEARFVEVDVVSGHDVLVDLGSDSITAPWALSILSSRRVRSGYSRLFQLPTSGPAQLYLRAANGTVLGTSSSVAVNWYL